MDQFPDGFYYYRAIRVPECPWHVRRVERGLVGMQGRMVMAHTVPGEWVAIPAPDVCVGINQVCEGLRIAVAQNPKLGPFIERVGRAFQEL